MNNIFIFVTATMLVCSCLEKKSETKEPKIAIDIWYGRHQRFGHNGLAQKWINVLGSVRSENGVSQLTYQLNSGEAKTLSLGPDLHRLASQGDFNVDLLTNDCREGKNVLKLTAIDSVGNNVVEEVFISMVKGNRWALPYTIKWSDVTHIQDAVQVVDGQWEITANGLQNKDVYYDRVIAFGDSTWRNYEVFTTVAFHYFSPPEKGPPTYNVSHAAIATRWPGHDIDKFQPHRKWYPLGATAEFRLTAGLDSCRWRIFDGPKPNATNFYTEQAAAQYRSIQLGKTYGMKHRVQSIGSDSTKYSVKLWPVEYMEPVAWDFVSVEQAENMQSGSALLLAHNTKVTFGDVMVVPIRE